MAKRVSVYVEYTCKVDKKQSVKIYVGSFVAGNIPKLGDYPAFLYIPKNIQVATFKRCAFEKQKGYCKAHAIKLHTLGDNEAPNVVANVNAPVVKMPDINEDEIVTIEE